MLVILTPQAMTAPTETAEALKAHAQTYNKPVLASWMGGKDVEAGEGILNRANIPTFPYPDTAARMFDYMVRFADNLRSLYETPQLPTNGNNHVADRDHATQIIQAVRRSGRTILTEFESKQILAAYGVPTVETRIAASQDEAVKAAEQIGYPVVLKLYSETITHKTDVGGVQLNLAGAESVRQAFHTIEAKVGEKVGAEHFQGVTVQPMIKLEGYELIIGSSIDPQFGPVLLFGLGGQLVEVFQDRALGLPPLNTVLARRMMERTRIYKALKGVRGRQAIDLAELEQLLVRFSQMIAEQHWIKEVDINPLLASPERLLALDARVVVHGLEVSEDALPQLAIRPYPSQYASKWIAKDGTPLTIRPVLPEDEPLLVAFHETLSERSVYMYFLHPMLFTDRVRHERLSRIRHCDYDREFTFIVEHKDPQTGERRMLGAARMTKMHLLDQARFSIVISDHAQGIGIGAELVRHLIQVARDEKLRRIGVIVLSDNHHMQHILESQGFRLVPFADGKLHAELDL
jgi:acetyltransferase